jgi:protein TonB
MNKLILVLLLLIRFSAWAQNNESYYIFDADWNPIKNIKKAKFFLHSHKMNDTCWQFDYYNFTGPRLKTESYRDQDAKIPNGFFAYYNNDGYLDSCGYVANWHKNQDWTYFHAESGKVYLKKTYDHGTLVKTEDFSNKEEEKADTGRRIFSDVEIESEFEGGLKSWQTFLNKNLKYPQRAIDASVQGTVWVVFIVDKEGKVSEPVIAKSVEFSIDQESLRIIQISPKWHPAFQNGRLVKSYKKQPIIFMLQ